MKIKSGKTITNNIIYILALPSNINIKILVLQKSTCLTTISGVAGDIESIILAGSLLTSTVVYCFGCCVSAMDSSQNVDSHSALNFFANVPNDIFKKGEKQKSNLENSDIYSENFEFDDNFDFNVSFFEEKKYFNPTFNKELINSFVVKKDNIYFNKLRQKGEITNKFVWSDVCSDLSMLRIVRLILRIEYLRNTGKLKEECKLVDNFLDVVQRIKKQSLEIHDQRHDKKISDEDLLYFIDYFLPVLDSIRPTDNNVQKTLNSIKKSLRLDSGKSYKVNENGSWNLNKLLYKDNRVSRRVFQMLKTLDYFEKKQECRVELIQPEFLLKDYKEYQAMREKKGDNSPVLNFDFYNKKIKIKKSIK